jgi:hypothetical protein
MSGMAVMLALAGMASVAPALDAQEYADIQSQCRREAQEYGVEPEQIEEYVNGCVMAYGGMPAAEPETAAPPADAGLEVPAGDEQQPEDAGDQDTGAVAE